MLTDQQCRWLIDNGTKLIIETTLWGDTLYCQPDLLTMIEIVEEIADIRFPNAEYDISITKRFSPDDTDIWEALIYMQKTGSNLSIWGVCQSHGKSSFGALYNLAQDIVQGETK